MNLPELITECQLRSKTFADMEAHLPDERLKISARSARDTYAEVVRMLKDLEPEKVDLVGIEITALDS